MPTFKLNELGDVLEDVKAELKSELMNDFRDNFDQVMENETEEIFERERDSDGQKWEPIKAISFITRDSTVPGSPFDSVEEMIEASQQVKPLKDTNSLFNSLVDNNSDSVRRATVNGNSVEFEFGTSREGAKTHQEGGKGSGLSPEDIDNASDHLEGSANKFLNALSSSQRGEVPQREFLYFTKDSVRQTTTFAVQAVVDSFREVVN